MEHVNTIYVCSFQKSARRAPAQILKNEHVHSLKTVVVGLPHFSINCRQSARACATDDSLLQNVVTLSVTRQ